MTNPVHIMNFPAGANPADFHFETIAHRPVAWSENKAYLDLDADHVEATFAIPKSYTMDNDGEFFLGPNGTLISERAKVAAAALIGPRVIIHAGTSVDGTSSIDPDSVLHQNVIIKAHSRIGSQATIGQNTVVAGSEIKDKVSIGSAGEIARSTIHSSAQLGDNIVCYDATILEGASIGHRSEIYSTVGKGANLGSRVEICAVIGNSSVVGDRAYISADVGQDAIVLPKVEVVRSVPDRGIAIGNDAREIVQDKRLIPTRHWLVRLVSRRQK